MIPIIQRGLEQALEGRHFNVCVDLGCGNGDAGRILRSHVSRLVGVDHSEAQLNDALATESYDELVLSDVRNYYPHADLVIFIEVIEHFPHEDGEQVLKRLSYIPNMIVTTPLDFFPNIPSMPHLCLWKEEELRQYGFLTQLLFGWFQPDIILATRFET